MSNKVLQIDFDNVIHRARWGFQKGEIYDEPSEGAEFTLNKLHDQGYELVILTSRPESDYPNIEAWLGKYNFPPMRITNRKEPARAYIDNRAIRFTNWADMAFYFL
jgi:phosphoglycolate phosphatase-like HAD superfamily hydrolase